MQFGAFEDTDHVALIIEYAAKGDLFDLLRHMGGRMKEADVVARIMTPFMKGLAYMHSLGVIHRDIKLENTLFSVDGTLKIADFGLSVDANHEAPVTRLGTLDYMSPGAPCIRHACSGPPAATRSTRAYPVLHLRSGCGMHATAQPRTRPSPPSPNPCAFDRHPNGPEPFRRHAPTHRCVQRYSCARTSACPARTSSRRT